MEKRFRLVGTGGEIAINEHVEGELLFAHMRFVKYVRDGSGEICGVKFMADKGHGYGFDHGEEEVILYPGEEYQFEHSYTDTDDGTWENGSFTVKVRLVEE